MQEEAPTSFSLIWPTFRSPSVHALYWTSQIRSSVEYL